MQVLCHPSVNRGIAMGMALIAIAACAQWAGAQPTLPDSAKGRTYVGNAQCKVCHNGAKEGETWNKWKGAKHPNAFNVLKTDKAKEVAAKAGVTTPPAESPECLRCHVTGYDVTTKSVPANIKMEDGVQCESCHGPSSDHIKIGKTIKVAPAKIADVDLLASNIQPTEENCRGCHNDTNPTYNPERYTTADGKKVDFDFKQAYEKIAHSHPEGSMEAKYGGKYPKKAE